MRIAQSNSAGIVIGSPQAYFTWYCRPAKKEILKNSIVFNFY
jgi:hypothetical protein